MANEMILLGKVRMMDKDARTIRFKIKEPVGCADMSLKYNSSSLVLEEKLMHALQDDEDVLLTVGGGLISRLRRVRDDQQE